MAFYKAFPRKSDKSVYPNWDEIMLDDEEEKIVEEKARQINIELMKECISDAKKISAEAGLKNYDSNITAIAIALFEKRSSHIVFWKENKAKEKFEEKLNS